MKISVEVDLSDFYSEDETSFNEQILSDISYRVKGEIFKQFKENGMAIVEKEVHNRFNVDFENEIKSTVKNIFEFKVVKDGLSYKEFVEKRIKESSYYREDRDIEASIKKLISTSEQKMSSEIKSAAISISNKLTERYDLLFASQLVAKLGANGMLKDDVAKLLLD